MMEIQLLNKDNFHIDSLDTFSRYQTVNNVYRLDENHLQLLHCPFTEDWSAERKREKAAEILSGQYIVYGVIHEGRVVGTIMLIPELEHGRMIIDSYHVSAEFRRQGIGRRLFEAARTEARQRGAVALYASACSSEETINFYMAMGFRVSRNPIQALVDAEPYNIQMECMIGDING